MMVTFCTQGRVQTLCFRLHFYNHFRMEFEIKIFNFQCFQCTEIDFCIFIEADCTVFLAPQLSYCQCPLDRLQRTVMIGATTRNVDITFPVEFVIIQGNCQLCPGKAVIIIRVQVMT